MDPGYRTPLIDLFRKGDVDKGIRLLGAQGALALRAHEQLALLMILLEDPDPDVASKAEETIAALPAPALSAFLARGGRIGDDAQFLRESRRTAFGSVAAARCGRGSRGALARHAGRP